MTHTPTTLKIQALSDNGEGIAEYQDKPVFVSLTCPGDTIIATLENTSSTTLRAKLVEVVQPGAQRQTPPCSHFGHCGGCSLQHLAPSLYETFKHQKLATILQEVGANSDALAPLITVGPNSRRRAEFKVTTHQGNIQIGFYEAHSHNVIKLSECPICKPELLHILPELKHALETLYKPKLITAIHLTALESGLDAIIISRGYLSTPDKEKLIQFAKNQPIVRLSLSTQTPEHTHHSPSEKNSQCLYQNNKANITFDDVTVELPIGAFLQATDVGQATLTHTILEQLKNCSHVVDLYSGCGTYSFPLLKQVQNISAFEGSQTMIAAMNHAIETHKLSDRITATTRDLFKQPLKKKELSAFDGAVINPPRGGALPQIKALCQSTIEKIVMVSCNPTTFKRDAQYLIHHDYQLSTATAIDQFYWSSHLEVIATFQK